MTDHDAIYHEIFGTPEMVAQLVREFAAGPWLDHHDLDRIQRLNAKFHAETAERREGDVIWQIPRRGGGDTYVVLLLEIQSQPERWMVLRALVYVGLLWQHLIKEKQLLPDGKLPPVLPIVLHRGKTDWTAPLALRDLVGLEDASPFWQWQPDMQYYLIDERRFAEADLKQRRGLVPLLFRAENASDPKQLVIVADALMAEMARNPHLAMLRNAFGQLLAAILRPLAPGEQVPDDLLEVRNMSDSIGEIWRQNWFREGEQAGRREGEQAGRREGERVGRREGEEVGRLAGERAGEAAMLTRLLERRFGPLPSWAKDRIITAETNALEEWGLRVLDAASLEDVLT